ncbi:MAG: tRNA (adenosine(37)-N6)-dimethylallyltransferase MiaA [Candidatus Moraniibacteriota bacterium]
MKPLTKKTIVIVGPTASGKSDLAILLARRYDGEIISADSRQVYRGMDIGSGKVTKREQRLAKHWLLDVASPKRSYNVTHFVRDAKKALADIRKRGKVPIICGGTGFWAQTLIEGTTFPAVKPDAVLRKKLDKKNTAELFRMLVKKDPARAKTIDRHNKIRLIRALEICAKLGQVPSLPTHYKLPADNYTIIALNPNKETLKQNIEIRLKTRLGQGMVEETKHLHADGVSWKRLESFGLEYGNIALFLQKKITYETMCANIIQESLHYVTRQLTWLRRFEKMGAKIHWITDPKQALKIIKQEAPSCIAPHSSSGTRS